MTEEFKKHDQFFVNPERPEPGLTATSASFLAALASQEVNRLEEIVKSSTFYDVYMELLSGVAEPCLVQEGEGPGVSRVAPPHRGPDRGTAGLYCLRA